MAFRYSAINTAYQCLKRYELQYIKNLQPEIKSLDLEFGTAMHAGINAHFELDDPKLKFLELWSKVPEEGYDKSRFNKEQLGTIGTELLRKWSDRHAVNYESMYTEQRLKFKIRGFDFEGTPDFVGRYQGKLSIVDWKTTGYAYDKRKPIVDEQMWVYVEAVLQNYNFMVEQIVYAPLVKYGARVQTPIVYPVTAKKLENMIDNVELMAVDLSTREKFPMNRSNCLRCPFITTCYEETRHE